MLLSIGLPLEKQVSGAMERRLAAVLIADVAGYSRLSQDDEEGTRASFQLDLNEVFVPGITKHHGRLIKTMGDGLLVEFRSVVDAVRCAIDVQRIKAACKTKRKSHNQLDFRIGINLGDVIVEGDDIHGDGVNIADRLQRLAEPGGIVISANAYDQVQTRISIGFADLGEQHVKHIDKPVRAYRLLMDPSQAGQTIHVKDKHLRSRRRPALVAGVVLILTGGGVTAWLRPWEPWNELASVERMALPLPDKPSIVVLPMVNMSNDPAQDYFADGITDDLITELSKLPGLFVIARNTSFHYKGNALKIAQIAEELGVRYVLEGSVQRAGDRLRINAQLIDAVSGGHVWADRFDGSLADVFLVQDQVTTTTAEALALRLTPVQKAAIALQDTPIPEAYEAFLHGWDHYRRTTPADYAKSIPYFEKAIALDPNYSRAYAALAMVYIRSAARYWTDSIGMTIRQARAEARGYLQKSLRKPSALSHQAAGYFSLDDWSPNEALAEFKEAIALDPSDSWSYAFAAFALTTAERPAEAISYINAAVRLDPHPPALFHYYLGMAQFNMEQYESAAKSLEDATQFNSSDEYSYLALAATYGHLGKTAEAKSALNRYNALVVARGGTPATTATYSDFYYSYEDPQYKRLSLGLRLAGAPEYLGSGEFANQNKLSKEEIRKIILGHEAHGYSIVDGTERAALFAMDGRASMSGDWASRTKNNNGTIDFKGDELCMRFGSQLYCGAILHNPGGTRAKENEFIWVTSHAFPFSLVN